MMKLERALLSCLGGLTLATACSAPSAGGGGAAGAGGGGEAGGNAGSDATLADGGGGQQADGRRDTAGRGGGAGGGAGGAGGGSGDGPDAAPDRTVVGLEDGGRTCGELTTNIPYVPKTPDVVIAFDRSKSMDRAFGTGTRYATERDLLKPLVTMYQDRIRWGFEEFPSKGAAESGACYAGRVCVTPAPMNAAAVNAAIDTPTCVASARPPPKSTIYAGTPTPDALRNAREFYRALTDGIKDRYVLLSTDGEPVCSLDGGGPGWGEMGTARFCDEAVAEVKMLLADGVRTVVLGVSEEVAASACLERLAVAGGAPNPAAPPSFYRAADPASLEKYLGEIVRGIAKLSCFVDLTMSPPDAAKVALFFDRTQVPWDPSRKDGWEYDPANPLRILIYGSYCAKLEGSDVKEIAVRYGCPPCRGTVGCD